eukprot:111371_1
MIQPIISNPNVPCKPPLPNPLNLLPSIPNSAQLDNPVCGLVTTNTSFRNVLGIPATPPPPSVQLLQLQQTPFNSNSNSPVPILVNGASIPNKTKSRKRGKRGGKQKKQIGNQNLDKDQIDPTKRDLINAIGLERRNHELTKLRLYQLHQYYGNMLANLKQESKYLKNKITILKNGPSQSDLEIILKQKQALRNDYLKKRGVRVKDEAQLKQTNKENQKLVIIIHYLKQQLDGLLVQYQELCRNEASSANNKGYSDAQIIVNNLDSLDIVDAESMLSPEKHQMLNAVRCGNGIPQIINDDPWFQRIIEENRMLERHIRFLKHIIERETQRCNFKEIIVGKKLLSQQKIKPEKKEKENESRLDTQ